MADHWRSPLGCTTEACPTSAFKRWCTQQEIKWPACKIAELPLTGRGVVATCDIGARDVVVEVPDDAVLMADSCSISQELQGAGLTKPADHSLLEVQGLVLAVMHERALGSTSKWAPYLAFLPHDLSHVPLFWTEQERHELVGTAALDKLRGRVLRPEDASTRVDELWEQVTLPFLNDHPHVAEALLNPEPRAGRASSNTSSSSKKVKGGGGGNSTRKRRRGAADSVWEPHAAALAAVKQQYLWATAAVAAYSFVLGDDRYHGMVPVWDALNHVSGRANVRLHHDEERGALQMIATEPIPAGAEVINSYGPLAGSDLLRCYGYVERSNPAEHAQVPAQFVLRAAAAAVMVTGGRRITTRGRQGPAHGADTADVCSNGAVGEERGEGEDSSSSASEGSGGGFPTEGGSEAGSDDSWSSLQDDSELEDASGPQQDPTAGASAPGAAATAGAAKGARTGGIPSLAAAQQQHIPDWEGRWHLARMLRLLPEGGGYAVPAHGALSGELVALMVLLLLEPAQCEALATLAVNGGHAAATAAPTASDSLNASLQSSQHAAAGAEHLPLAMPQEPLLRSGLQQLMHLMLSRYSCTLEADQRLLRRLDALPPRLQAAVVVRAAEKQCLHSAASRLMEGCSTSSQLVHESQKGSRDQAAAGVATDSLQQQARQVLERAVTQGQLHQPGHAADGSCCRAH